MDIEVMREKLLVMYPRGYIRSKKIVDMAPNQIYAIYMNHRDRQISTKKPRINKEKQVPGQINMLGQM